MIVLDARKSRICIGAPCTLTVPGTVVSVVKSISDTSECVPVNFDIRVDCPDACPLALGDPRNNSRAYYLPHGRKANESH